MTKAEVEPLEAAAHDVVNPKDSRTKIVPDRFAQFAARLAFELLVVFAGVTLAFFAENQRDRREQAMQAEEIYAALATEIADHTTIGPRVLVPYLERQAEWDAAFARGEFPSPWFIPWSQSGPPRSTWEATLSSGAVSLIDRPMFYELAKYYRLVEMYMVPVDGQDAFVDAEIVPYVDQGPGAFYLPGKHELKPKYQAYIERRRTILAAARKSFEQGNALLEELRKRTRLPIAMPHR